MSDIEWSLGTWKCVATENHEAFHDVIGMPAPMREMLKQGLSGMRACGRREGEEYILTLSLGPGVPEHTERMRLGVEYASKDMLGNDSTNIVTNENGVVKEVRKADKYTITTTKTFRDGKLHMASECNGVHASSVWEKC